MPLFQYEAIATTGKKVRATIDADNLHDAKLKLIKREVVALKIHPVDRQVLQKSVLTRVELLNLTREIARLLQAGLPLYETLCALEEKYRGQARPHRLLLDLADSVRQGMAFSLALFKYPQTFDILYTSMIANAEKTGSLGAALQELAELISRQIQIKKQVVSALLYPALLCGFCVVVLSSLLFYVVPSLRELFEGRDLHPLTQIVFAASAFACKAKIPLALGAMGCLMLGVGAVVLPQWRDRILSLGYRLPWIRHVMARVAFIRFSRSVATLLEGGLPLVQAFAQGRTVMRHPALEKVVAQAEEKIAQGQSIHSPFENHPLIPPLVPRMIGIAEEGGKLPFMMRQIAQIYEEELEKILTHFANLAQPVLLLVLGIIIGFVLLSVLLPLTDVSSFATN